MTKLHISEKTIPKTVFFIVIIFLISLVMMVVNKNIAKTDTITLDKNWNIEYNDEIIKDKVTLSEYSFDITNKGDVIKITGTLPNSFVKHPALKFTAYHSEITVRIDGKIIYEYGDKAIAREKAVGSGVYVVSLPDNYQEKEVQIQFFVTENKAFPNIDAIELINENKYVEALFCSQIIDIFTGIFTVMLGLLAIIMILLVHKFNNTNRRILWMGIMTLCLGIWLLTSRNIMAIFIDNRTIISYLEYSSLYLCVPSIGMLFYEMQRRQIFKKITFWLCMAIFVADVFIVALDKFNIHHLTAMLVYEQIFGGTIVIVTAMMVVVDYKELEGSDKIIMNGVGILTLIMAIEIVRFNTKKYIQATEHSKSYLSFGLLLFVIVLVVAVFKYSKEYVDIAVDRQALTRMAFVDMLTGIYNRTAIMDKLDEIELSEKKEFIIFNFDLNNLKKVNDNIGHFEGDKYIMEFTEILKICLGDFATIGRVGGDEFVAIIEKAYKESEADKIIDRMLNMIKAKNQKNKFGWDMSFSYGYAVSSKTEYLNVWEAYDRADGKMYECKKRQKAESAFEI